MWPNLYNGSIWFQIIQVSWVDEFYHLVLLQQFQANIHEAVKNKKWGYKAWEHFLFIDNKMIRLQLYL